MGKEQQQGIYCITNIDKNKKYINYTRNVHTYKGHLIKRLNSNKHKNKRLQNDWLLYQDSERENVFNFEILETIDDPSMTQQRKEYWVNYYRSNEIEYGYNLEMYKRPWEKNRDEWKRNKTWGASGDIHAIFNSITSKLDYSLEFAEDRLRLVNQLLEGANMSWLIDYISSPLFAKKQYKDKKDFLAENDVSLFGFSRIVDYLVFPKYKNKEEKDLTIEEEYSIRKKKTELNMDYRRGNEKLFGNKEEIEPEVNKTGFEKNLKKARPKIEQSDLEKYPEIKEVYDVIEYLKDILGQTLDTESRQKVLDKLVEKYGEKQVVYMKRMYRDLSKEILEMKRLLSKEFEFKRITRGTTKFDFDNDTGYFNEQEDYILVSENKIDFSKEKHILELLNHYSQLRQSFYDKPDSDMWAILYDLENLIENTKFEDHIKDILIMKIDQYYNSEIAEHIKETYGIELTSKRVSEIYNNFIPKMIVETYLQEREDWIFTYKAKGTYKTCSKCKEVKLLNEKYFRKRTDKKGDGYYSYCRGCENKK